MNNKQTSKDKWIDYWRKKYVAECQKVLGYEELARMHSAYITTLLNKLGATEDNMVTITLDEVKEALEKFEARAKPAENGYGLYCEVIAEE